MQATIRAATAEDIEALLGMWQAAGTEPTHTDDIHSLRRLLEFDPGALLLAEVGGDLVGSVIAGWDGWRGSIYRPAVVPGQRRQGLAGELVRASVARLRAMGATRLQAIVVDDDDRAMGFWGDSGWDKQAHRARFVLG